MNNEEILKELKITDDIMLSELYEALNDELSKPESKQNHKIIIELSKAICEIKGDDLTDAEVENGKEKILSKINNRTPVSKRLFKIFMSVAASTAAVFILNVFTVNAFNVSIFPKLYERANGSIVIYFDQDRMVTEEIIKIIDQKCIEHNIYEFLPSYLPNGYSLEILNEDNNHLRFCLTNNNKKINISYLINTQMKSVGIPSDEGFFYEENINGTQFTISTEDDQYRAIANTENVIFRFTSYYVGDNESKKIIKSLTHLRRV